VNPSSPRGQILLVFALVAALVISAEAAAFLFVPPKPAPSGRPVPNLQIVAGVTGFNDSVDHGVPQNSWPVIHVARGTLVNITVFNDDRQAHGFQISHYFNATIVTVAPGQKLNVSFLADVSGTFRIYCSIPCTVHWAMQSGKLVVS
jgi:heme/copper-type cytochrome/quinol oxidase subunit 2